MYLSLKIEQLSAVFLGIDEQPEINIIKTNKKLIFNVFIFFKKINNNCYYNNTYKISK